MNHTIKKYYKLIASIFAFAINSFGLILSIIGASPNSNFSESKKFIIFLLIMAEIFLVLSAVYSMISIIKNANSRISVEQKEVELQLNKNANKTIFENHKASIAYYKDFHDKLQTLITNYTLKRAKLHELKVLISSNQLPTSYTKDKIENHVQSSEAENFDSFKTEMIDLYNRFIINIIDLLQESIEAYLQTKGCSTPVAIALKQLDQPAKYSKIDDKKNNIYTAFRDKKTYLSKTRNETWQKSFCIRKNSDFVFSIEKDYYIFNFVTKMLSENGLYLNENTNFYENYNSGVTCTIHSCVGKERILYGFLACDSLFDKQMEKKCGKNIYDYNVANMLMSTAHIIALFLSEFLEIWDKYCIQVHCDMSNETAYRMALEKYNLCNVMIERLNTTRYRS